MVDRRARDELVAVIERYLNDEILAFEFADATEKAAKGSEDRSVWEVVFWLWFTYDDLTNHKVIASKSLWDWFQRLLLLLKSDGEIVLTRRREWTRRQAWAACGVVAFVASTFATGFTSLLLLPCALLGCLALVLNRWQRRDEKARTGDSEILFPFASVGEMLAVRRSVSGFRKCRYPSRLEKRRLRGDFLDLGLVIRTFPLILVFSPLVLLLQSFPEKASECRVAITAP
ncbi:hypothetical protein LLH03_11380 [bacterium]|nr:hypothetical protein [bacterium]